MTLLQVFDPLFRVPLANGLLLALVLPLLGAYVRLRNEWLAALGLAQVTAAGGVMAILVGIHPLAGALGALALMHYFTTWPATYQDAALLAVLSGAGALGMRLYNRRVVRPGDDERPQ